MEIQGFVCNLLQENTYVIWDETNQCVLVDPGCIKESEFAEIDRFIANNGLKPCMIINTHGHFDHIFGVEKCRSYYGIKWGLNPNDSFLVEDVVHQCAAFGIVVDPISPCDVEFSENDVVKFGNTTLTIFHVPGHSPGSLCYYEENSEVLFTGDALFKHSIGRTDLAQGNYRDLITNLETKILQLPDDVIVYPGHGPATTIGEEKRSNPYLR